MKRNKLVVFAIVMLTLTLSQPAVSEKSPKPEGYPTAWTQFNLKGVDKDLASKIAAQITATPKNAADLVAALVTAKPDHAEAITTVAIAIKEGQNSPKDSNLEQNLAPKS